MRNTKRFLSVTAALGIMLGLSACAQMEERINNIGKAPELAKIENPVAKKDYRPVSLPMPTQVHEEKMSNSLWNGARQQTFFKDQRAKAIGDILTVMIEIDDKADIKNTTERDRDDSSTSDLSNLMGFESKLGKVLPDAADPTKLIDTGSKTSTKGEGTITRKEKIELVLAATIVQKLANGNFVISGRQQVRVNSEMRDLSLQGVIRPEDISNSNSISYEKIAEARISYGGAGNISELQQPRYGQQLYEIVYPF